MKRETTKRQRRPTTAALREMPEIDFSVFRIRRNPFAQRIGREGIEVAHDGPSQRALAEMPETDFSRVRMRANKYARQAAAAAANIQYGKGRPRRGTEVGPTPTRSLRLPETIWKALEREA